MKLKSHLEHLIHLNGAMPLDQFLSLAISYYYSFNEPFNSGGDFITAPEISQMFGEIIGVWCVNTWLAYNSPQINLIEIGGGRGTLMDDLLRATRHIEKFHENINKIYMIETSARLIKSQKNQLKNYKNVEWANSLNVVEPRFNIIVCNEFFDALPIKQFVKTSSGFKELYVTMHNSQYVIIPAKVEVTLPINCNVGDIVECSPQRELYASQIGEIINSHGGAILIIDYGFKDTVYKSTLQSVKDNKKQDYFFDNLGSADISSHVDFSSLIKIFETQSLQYKFSSQGEFLKYYGIEIRAKQLIQKGANQSLITSQLKRLISSQEMGELFKVLEIYN
jgi:NADH dehydrogenase [ubiquinone] 1 alpha subcomplex assembly factor 7